MFSSKSAPKSCKKNHFDYCKEKKVAKTHSFNAEKLNSILTAKVKMDPILPKSKRSNQTGKLCHDLINISLQVKHIEFWLDVLKLWLQTASFACTKQYCHAILKKGGDFST